MTGNEHAIKEARFDAGEVEINYAEGPPDNGPPILLVHGVGGMWQYFLDVYALIQDRWHVYAVDLRGHGKSGHTDSGYDFKDYPRDIVAFVSQVISRPTVIWGHSLGAIATMGVGGEIPELVSAVILEDPPMIIINSPDMLPFQNNFIAIQGLLLEQPPDDQVLAILREIGPGQTEEAYQRRLSSVRNSDPAIYDGLVEGKSGPGWDPEAVLARITSPTLLMQADPDLGALLLDEHAEKAMGILADAQHVKFPGIGHSIHAAVTQEAVDLMERFVRERAPCAAPTQA